MLIRLTPFAGDIALVPHMTTGPLVFTWIVENVAGYKRQMFSLHVHVYLDDWLLRHQQREFLLHKPRIVQFLRSLGWEVNVDKLSLTPSQSFEYLGLFFRSDLGSGSPGRPSAGQAAAGSDDLFFTDICHSEEFSVSSGTVKTS